jgi:hypothetical protein
MLEQPALLLRPDGVIGPPASWRVSIDQSQDGAVLGFAERRGGRGRFAWLRWWATPFFEVHESHETDDEPLLLTVRQVWGTRWQVQDADGVPVGRLRGGTLLDRKDQPLAVLRRGADRRTASYRDAQQRELAVTVCTAEGVRLTFLPEGDGNPFVKMVLLAATLVHNESALIH